MYQLVQKKCTSWYEKNEPAGTKKMYQLVQKMYQLVHLTSLPDLATIYLGRKNLQPVEKIYNP